MTQFWLCPERLSDSDPARDNPVGQKKIIINKQTGVLQPKTTANGAVLKGESWVLEECLLGLPAAGEMRLKRAITKWGDFTTATTTTNLDNNPRLSGLAA